jgi:4-amino-4-deoxy-L-arabinose transferase-like glycosyltransferase
LDRQRPPALDWRFAAFWAVPWLLEFVVVHIGKPGYVLPLLPLLFIILAGFYARRGRGALVTLISAQIAANVAYVTVLAPASASSVPEVRYRDKPRLQRLKSDLQPLTFPTLATLAKSDARIDALLAIDRSTCRSGEWIAVAGADPIDWRRAMYYLPLAHVIRLLPNGETPSIGRNGDVVDVPSSGMSISSECGLLWMTDHPPPVNTEVPGRHIDRVGWMFPSGSGRVTREAVAWAPR